MHVLADLGAGADRGPGVDHGAGIDIGADIDEGRHQHRARRDIGGAAHDRRRHGAKAGLLEIDGAPAVEFRRHLVPPHGLAGAALDDLHRVEPEGQQHRLLQPLVDLPLAVGLALGDAGGAAVEQVERRLDGVARFAACRGRNRVALLEGLLDGLFEARQIGLRHEIAPLHALLRADALTCFESRADPMLRLNGGQSRLRHGTAQ